MDWFRRMLSRMGKSVEHPFGRVDFDPVSVRYHAPDGVMHVIRWDEVDEIGIVRTDEGPMSDDLFFTLTTADHQRGCAVPQSATGTDALVAHLEALPGFSRRSLTDAMGSTTSESFTLWKRKQ
jgi:hypothetical protein